MPIFSKKKRVSDSPMSDNDKPLGRSKGSYWEKTQFLDLLNMLNPQRQILSMRDQPVSDKRDIEPIIKHRKKDPQMGEDKVNYISRLIKTPRQLKQRSTTIESIPPRNDNLVPSGVQNLSYHILNDTKLFTRCLILLISFFLIIYILTHKVIPILDKALDSLVTITKWYTITNLINSSWLRLIFG